MTLTEKLNRFPPIMCRLVARTGVGRASRGLSHSEIAQLSGLERSTVAKLSKRETWEGCTLETIDAFSTACGVDLLHTTDQVRFLRHKKKTHITNSPNQAFYKDLLSRIKALGGQRTTR